MIVYMKKFTIALLGAIFVALIACSIQSVSADHESSEGIFKDKSEVNLVTTQDSDYQVYLQAVLRNGDGQLISIIESTANAGHISHKLTDDIFDMLLGKKEIITIDNIKYEKVQYTTTPTLVQRTVEINPIFEEIPLEQFTIYDMDEDTLAEMNESIKNYFKWRIHYCATFEGHEYSCIPVFQTLVPTMTLEPDDVITLNWTILREFN